MKYFIFLLVLSLSGLNAQKVSWDSPNSTQKTAPKPTAAYQSAYNDVQIGQATYYADYLAGKPTASGEAYRLDQMTASHAVLPTGTILQVTRLDNGSSVKIRVNDNNGHSDGSLVVLSRQAAFELGMLTSGRARVSVKRIGFDNWNPKPTTANSQLVARTVPNQPATYGTQPAATQSPATYSVPKTTASVPTKPYYRPASYGSAHSTPDFEAAPTTPPTAAVVMDDPYAYRVATSQQPTPPAYTGYQTPKAAPVTKREVAPSAYGNTAYSQPVATSAVAPVNEVQIASNTVQQGYGIQLAAYGNVENAQRQVRSLQNQGVENIYIASASKPDGSTINRVMVGPFATAAAAQSDADALARERQIAGIVVQLK